MNRSTRRVRAAARRAEGPGAGLAAVFALLMLAALLLLARGAQAGTAVRMQVADLAREADLIVEGRVLSARGVEDPSGRIDTEYLLAVERTLWGEPHATRGIRLPGGQLPDGRGMVLSGVPRLGVGEDVLLFLSPAAPSGMRMPTGLAQGRFRVARDARGHKSLVRAPGALALVDPRTGALHEADGVLRFDYAATLAEVEAALSVRRAAARAAAEARREAAGSDPVGAGADVRKER